MEDQAQRIKDLEAALAPFAKLGGQLGFQSERADTESVVATLAGKVTIGDFRRASAALRQYIGSAPR